MGADKTGAVAHKDTANVGRVVPFAHFLGFDPTYAHLKPRSSSLPPIASPLPSRPEDPSALAAQIILAGRKRRVEIVSGPDISTPAGRTAAAILAAGRKRRVEIVSGPDISTPAGRTAAAILAAGRKARGLNRRD